MRLFGLQDVLSLFYCELQYASVSERLRSALLASCEKHAAVHEKLGSEALIFDNAGQECFCNINTLDSSFARSNR